MSSYSNYIKSVKANARARFFGEVKERSNKYFTFKHYISDDEIIIVTANVKYNYKNNSFMLMVDNNKAVYLKDWCVELVHNYDYQFDGYAVKLNRQYFKAYTFKNDFENMMFQKEQTFDDLVQTAKEQDEANLPIALGIMK